MLLSQYGTRVLASRSSQWTFRPRRPAGFAFNAVGPDVAIRRREDMRRWTKKETALLLALSREPVRVIAARVGRSERAVTRKLRRSLRMTRRGPGSPWLSLRDVAARAGVHRSVIVHIGKELGQAWPHRRTRGRANRNRIDEAEAEAMLTALQEKWGRWARRHAECRGCGSRARVGPRRHHAHGSCVACRGSHRSAAIQRDSSDDGDEEGTTKEV